MALERIHWRNNLQVLFFRPPPKQPAQVVVLNLLLILSAVIATYNVVRLLFDVAPIFSEVTNPLYAEFVENPLPGDDPAVHDAIAIMDNTMFFVVVSLAVAGIFVPVRYLYLIFRSHWPAPKVYRSIRSTAILQIVIETVNFVFVSFVFFSVDLLVVDVTPNFGLNIITGPAILLWLRKPVMRRYFSHAREEREPDAIMPERARLPGVTRLTNWAGRGDGRADAWGAVDDPTMPPRPPAAPPPKHPGAGWDRP